MCCSSFYSVVKIVFLCLVLSACFVLQAEPVAVRVSIKAVNGHATYSTNGITFSPLSPGDWLAGPGLALSTDAASTVDFILLDSGTTLRLMPESSITFTRLNKIPVGEQVVSDTTLELLKGSVIGAQRKLAVPSRFDVIMPQGVATIVGTQYVINAGGDVSVLNGEVTIRYNLPRHGGSVKATIPQGFTFDPTTGKVVPTNAAYLKNIVDDINTVKENAQTFKINNATIVIKPEEEESPDKGHDHDDHDNDNDGRHGGEHH